MVDDAIVDVENVFRRLKENQQAANPKPILKVIYDASSEVRNSIVYATIIVVLVFIPLFYMQGIEGKIFAPLGIAYITSIVASLFVSLTVTPALCSYLLKSVGTKNETKKQSWFNKFFNSEHSEDSTLVKWLKKQDTKVLHWGLTHSKPVITVSAIIIFASIAIVPFFGTEFLPPFNEGSFTINLSAAPGTSLEESNKIGTMAEKLMMKVPEVEYVSRRTGRAELDEHVEPVSNSEIEVELKSDISRSRDEILADIRKQLTILKGVNINVGQPISHRLDHLLSGVRAQVAIKLFGKDLTDLRTNAGKIKEIISTVSEIGRAHV